MNAANWISVAALSVSLIVTVSSIWLGPRIVATHDRRARLFEARREFYTEVLVHLDARIADSDDSPQHYAERGVERFGDVEAAKLTAQLSVLAGADVRDRVDEFFEIYWDGLVWVMSSEGSARREFWMNAHHGLIKKTGEVKAAMRDEFRVDE